MKKIAILTGGTSSEREVSRWSAEYVVEALRGRVELQVFDLPRELDVFLAARTSFDVAIPVMHGRGGEDGQIQGFLKTLGMPFLFSGVEAHAIGMNKRLAKLVATNAGITTPESLVIARPQAEAISSSTGNEIASSASGLLAMTGSVVVKPIDGGSTVGVSIARTPDELDAALDKAFALGNETLVETFVAGREFTVSVIEENGKAIALPVTEILAKDGFFDFESKYVDGKMAGEVCPADILEALSHQLQDNAVRMHNAIGARHATRSDFIVDANGSPWFLEINTIPGMTKNSLLPKAVRASGRDFGELLVSYISSCT